MISVIAMVRQAESRTDAHWNETTPIDSTQKLPETAVFRTFEAEYHRFANQNTMCFKSTGQLATFG